MKDLLNQLREQERELRDKLGENLKNQEGLQKLIWEESTGITEGTDILIHRGEKGQYVTFHKGYPYVRMYKKDGTLGVRSSRVWSSDGIRKA